LNSIEVISDVVVLSSETDTNHGLAARFANIYWDKFKTKEHALAYFVTRGYESFGQTPEGDEILIKKTPVEY
jgi:hypothetical protein